MLTRFLQRLLEITDRPDGFAVQLVGQLGDERKLPDAALVRQLLWDCAAQAIRIDDGLALEAIRRKVEGLEGSDDSMIELSGRIVQLAAANTPQRAEELWEWHTGWASDKPEFGLTAMRVGASSLRVGHATLALKTAIALRGDDIAAWRTYFESDGAAASEAIRDQLYGFLLGEDAQHYLLEFVDFAESVVTVIAP
jgi:hypothetical protein